MIIFRYLLLNKARLNGLKEKTRFLFVDLLRGWALLIMIEVHVFNTMLHPALKTTDWFSGLNFINGLVAPSFLFISGFAFMLSSQSVSLEMRKFKYPFWKKLGRIALIFLTGYSLHLPILSLRRIINFYNPGTILRIYNVDILQCIAAGLLILFIARILIKRDSLFFIFTVVLLLITVFAAPIVWETDFGKILPVPLAAYFNDKYGSLFPLFPWLGFLLAGAISCDLFLRMHKKNADDKYFLTLFIIGLLFILVSYFLPVLFRGHHIGRIHPQPLFFIERLGYVILLLTACRYYIQRRNITQSFVLDVGRESLLIYWLHLQILYRKFYDNNSLVDLWGRHLGLLECIIFTLILAALMIVVAKYWGGLKNNYRPLISKLTFIFVSLLVVIFLIGF